MSDQLSIFAKNEPSKEAAQWELYTDGASRSNPGPAGAGIYLLKNGMPVEERGFFLGPKTNNEAEYIAMLIGLHFATMHMDDIEKLTVLADSELMIKQLKGVYRVKNERLKPLYACAQGYLANIHTTYIHVRREKNKIADKLANVGIDKKIQIPEEFLTYCKAYGISKFS